MRFNLSYQNVTWHFHCDNIEAVQEQFIPTNLRLKQMECCNKCQHQFAFNASVCLEFHILKIRIAKFSLNPTIFLAICQSKIKRKSFQSRRNIKFVIRKFVKIKSAHFFSSFRFWRIRAFYFWLWYDFISLKIECVHCEHFVFINLLTLYICALLLLWTTPSVSRSCYLFFVLNYGKFPASARGRTKNARPIWFFFTQISFPFITPLAFVLGVFEVFIKFRTRNFWNAKLKMHCVARICVFYIYRCCKRAWSV